MVNKQLKWEQMIHHDEANTLGAAHHSTSSCVSPLSPGVSLCCLALEPSVTTKKIHLELNILKHNNNSQFYLIKCGGNIEHSHLRHHLQSWSPALPGFCLWGQSGIYWRPPACTAPPQRHRRPTAVYPGWWRCILGRGSRKVMAIKKAWEGALNKQTKKTKPGKTGCFVLNRDGKI